MERFFFLSRSSSQPRLRCASSDDDDVVSPPTAFWGGPGSRTGKEGNGLVDTQDRAYVEETNYSSLGLVSPLTAENTRGGLGGKRQGNPEIGLLHHDQER